MSRGIQNIEFIEAKNLSVTYDVDGNITAISSGGDSLELASCYKMLYESPIKRGANLQNMFDRLLTVELLDDEANAELLLQSFYGWVVKYRSGAKYFVILDPLFAKESSIDTQLGYNYALDFNHNVESNKQDIEFIN